MPKIKSQKMPIKRFAVWLCVPYAIGLFFAVIFADKLAFFISLPFVLYAFFRFVDTPKKILVTISAFTIGISNFCLYNAFLYHPQIALNGLTVRFSGAVSEKKETGADGALYILKGSIISENALKNLKILCFSSDLQAEYGDKITADFALSTIENKYYFPAKDYYKSKNIFLQADKAENISVFHTKFSLVRCLMTFREKIIYQFQEILPRQQFAIAAALLLGDTSYEDNEIKRDFQEVGIVHVTSVSGFHLAIITILLDYFFKILRFKRIFSFFSGEIILILFTILTGAPIPVVRSFIMCTIWRAAKIFIRMPDALNTLCISFVFMTICSPFSITNSSFLLSFAGVLGVAVIAPHFTSELYKKSKKYTTPIKRFALKIAVDLIFMAIVSICIFPTTLLFFDFYSLTSPLANIILIPFCSLAIILFAIAACFCVLGLFAYPIIFVGGFLIQIVIWGCKIISEIPTLPISNDNLIYIVLLCLGSLSFVFITKKELIPKVFTTQICAFAAVLTILNLNSVKPRIAYISGAAVVSKGDYADVFDSGASRFDYKSVIKYLELNNVKKIRNIVFLDDEQYLFMKYENYFDEKTNFIFNGKNFTDNLKIDRLYRDKLADIDFGYYTLLITGDKNEPFVLSLR